MDSMDVKTCILSYKTTFVRRDVTLHERHGSMNIAMCNMLK